MRAFFVVIILLISSICKGQTVSEAIKSANTFCEQNNANGALDILNSAIDKNLSSDSLFYYRGLVKTDYLGLHKEAIDDFSKSIEINPRFAYGYFGVGKANLELKNYSESLKNFTKAIKLNPNFFEANFNLGYTYYQMGWDDKTQFKRAIPYFSKALELRTDYFDSYLLRAISQYQLGNYKMASGDFLNYEDLVPSEKKDTSFYYYYAFNTFNLGNEDSENYSLAATLFTNYLERDSLNADVLFHRGVSNMKAFNVDEAIADLTKYTSSVTNNADAFLYLAELYFNSENLDRSFINYQKAAALGKKEAKGKVDKLNIDRLQHVSTNQPKVSFSIEKIWSYEELSDPAISSCSGVIIHDPYFKLNIAIFKNDSLAKNVASKCDIRGHWFNQSGVEDQYSTSSYKWKRIKANDTWAPNDFEKYPVQVWTLTPNVDKNCVILYIWGEPKVMEDLKFFVEEFLESFRISV